MTSHVKALLVHYLTATGAVFAMLAMLAAVGSNLDMMFLWLVIAFFVLAKQSRAKKSTKRKANNKHGKQRGVQKVSQTI